MTSDWVSLAPLLALPGLCGLAGLVVAPTAPVASCDRRCVAVALSSSLRIAVDPLPRLRLGGP